MQMGEKNQLTKTELRFEGEQESVCVQHAFTSKWTTQPMYVELNIEARSRNNFCSGKAISITYFSVYGWVYMRVGARACECVPVGFHIQHATRMRHVVTSFSVPLAPPYFRHYLIDGMFFGKMSLNIKYFDFILQLLSKTLLILRKI
jgi:hypothetical protein